MQNEVQTGYMTWIKFLSKKKKNELAFLTSSRYSVFFGEKNNLKYFAHG